MFFQYKVVISHGFKKEKYVSNLCIARERRNKVNRKKKRILTNLGYDKGNTQSPSFDAASWKSSTNIVPSSILSHIYQHENELKHYFIKYKACIVHCFENTAHSYVIHQEYIYICFHQLNIAHER
jgi:hypothetical protein